MTVGEYIPLDMVFDHPKQRATVTVVNPAAEVAPLKEVVAALTEAIQEGAKAMAEIVAWQKTQSERIDRLEEHLIKLQAHVIRLNDRELAR